jgi:hypothetical protein
MTAIPDSRMRLKNNRRGRDKDIPCKIDGPARNLITTQEGKKVPEGTGDET